MHVDKVTPKGRAGRGPRRCLFVFMFVLCQNPSVILQIKHPLPHPFLHLPHYDLAFMLPSPSLELFHTFLTPSFLFFSYHLHKQCCTPLIQASITYIFHSLFPHPPPIAPFNFSTSPSPLGSISFPRAYAYL